MSDQLCLERPTGLGLPPGPAPEEVQVGVDLLLHREGATPDDVATVLLTLAGDFRLDTISSWGRQVWPTGAGEAMVADCWRCRFTTRHGDATTQRIDALRDRLTQAGLGPLRLDLALVAR